MALKAGGSLLRREPAGEAAKVAGVGGARIPAAGSHGTVVARRVARAVKRRAGQPAVGVAELSEVRVADKAVLLPAAVLTTGGSAGGAAAWRTVAVAVAAAEGLHGDGNFVSEVFAICSEFVAPL